MLLPIDQIERDDDIYPRQNVSRATVESYLDSLRAGARFPAIEVQRIREGGVERTICLDGWHRLEAYREYNGQNGSERIEKVEATQWRDEVLDKQQHLVDLMVRSAELNTRHGLRLPQGDIKYQLRKIAQTPDSLSLVWKDIASSFGVTPEWASECVSGILAQKRMGRDALIYKLSLLGWTHQEIGELVGLGRSTVTENVGKLNELNLSTVKVDSFEKGKSIAEVAEYYHLDYPLTWAVLLGGKDDLERLKKLSESNEGLSCGPRPYDIWNFSGCHPLFGYEYEGRIPGQLVLQLLYFYTRQGDLVVDPMAGSGTTVDACLVMNRRCRASDINPECPKRRPEVRTGDAISVIEGLKGRPNLVFLDPPYYRKKEKEYGDRSISSLSRGEYLEYFGKLAKASYRRLQPDGHVALLMSDYTEDEPEDSIFIHHYIHAFEAEGFTVERIVLCPLSAEQFHPDIQNRFTRDRRLARLARYLVVFRRGD
jgi:hypothetical protein